MQGEVAPELRVSGLRVTRALRFPSPFQPEEGQDKRQKQLEEWGVKVTTSIDEAISDVDGVILSLNDGSMHFDYVRRIAACGKPLFLDKPMADTVKEAEEICRIVQKNKTKFWTSSSLRFDHDIHHACHELAVPDTCSVYGPIHSKPFHSGRGVLWYGIHTFEMVSRIMGLGAKSAWAKHGARGLVAQIAFENGRQATIEFDSKNSAFGGRLQAGDKSIPFMIDSTALYSQLLHKVRDFFLKNEVPVSLQESVEIQATIDAVERSLVSGKEEPIQYDVSLFAK
jgi:hypothetical protein